MKKYFLFLATTVLFLCGCVDTSFQYKPSAQLEAKYDDYVKDQYLTVYYELKDAPDGQLLMMSIKNTGSIFMKNLSLTFDQTQVKNSGFSYKNLGSLKNRSVKDFSIAIPKGKFESLKFDYSFTPIQEDGFLNPDSPIGHVDIEPITGTITLYFDK